jgi:hypothetical protein
MQTRINSLNADFVNRDDPAQRAVIERDRQKALAELGRLKQGVLDTKKAIADLEEEARRAGVRPAGCGDPPGACAGSSRGRPRDERPHPPVRRSSHPDRRGQGFPAHHAAPRAGSAGAHRRRGARSTGSRSRARGAQSRRRSIRSSPDRRRRLRRAARGQKSTIRSCR